MAVMTAPDIYRRELLRLSARLGRTVAHDPRSRGFARPTAVDKSTWRDKAIRIYDPSPNPNQTIGNCTAVAKCIQFNARGDRAAGHPLNMGDADRLYTLETRIDPFKGQWPPTDTGSNGLASAKAAQQVGLGGAYWWLFGGADEVVQAIMDDDVVSNGTRWDEPMFNPDSRGQVHPDPSATAGGHQWVARGYDLDRDLILGRCWWGAFRDFWISRADLDDLLHDDGDAHVQAHA